MGDFLILIIICMYVPSKNTQTLPVRCFPRKKQVDEKYLLMQSPDCMMPPGEGERISVALPDVSHFSLLGPCSILCLLHLFA